MAILQGEEFYISKRIGKAVADYNMLADGDKVAVGVSGGKDSLTLLRILNKRRSFVPIKYELVAVHIDLGYPVSCTRALERYFQQLGVRYHIETRNLDQGKFSNGKFSCSVGKYKIPSYAAKGAWGKAFSPTFGGCSATLDSNNVAVKGSAEGGLASLAEENLPQSFATKSSKACGKFSCFWCSWNRRKALFETADRLGCSKVALGHHYDDIVQTILLNLFFHGEISAMLPKQELFSGKIILIRPLAYVEEAMIKRFAKEAGFPKQRYICPNSRISNRTKIAGIIKELKKICPDVKKNIFRSVKRIKKDYLL